MGSPRHLSTLNLRAVHHQDLTPCHTGQQGGHSLPLHTVHLLPSMSCTSLTHSTISPMLLCCQQPAPNTAAYLTFCDWCIWNYQKLSQKNCHYLLIHIDWYKYFNCKLIPSQLISPTHPWHTLACSLLLKTWMMKQHWEKNNSLMHCFWFALSVLVLSAPITVSSLSAYIFNISAQKRAYLTSCLPRELGQEDDKVAEVRRSSLG